MVKFKFNYKGKKYELDVKECKNIFSKSRGLMFKKNSKPLLFIFNNSKKRGIHSFFCKPFVAIWFNNGRVVDVKLIKSKKVLIKPREKFDKLLEIPSNSEVFKDFTDERNL
jgi:uncharacterized membrane protein (UPF0127 family)